MKVSAIKTHVITQKDIDITKILDRYVTEITEHSVLAVTSKIVSISEGRIVPRVKVSKVPNVSNGDFVDHAELDSASQRFRVKPGMTQGWDLKDELIKQEAQWYLPRSVNPYGVSFTITQHNLVATAGIDESNANNAYVLWPKNPYESANTIRAHIRKKFGIKNVGVIIVDSRTVPLRWGVTAFALSYSGFKPLKDYTGEKDLFGRAFVFEKLNIADGLATAAGLVMGEGAEQTPLAIIEDIPHIKFVEDNPTEEELASLAIDMDHDLYGPFLKSVEWKKGKGR